MYTLSIILNLHRKAELVEKTIHNLQKIIELNRQTKKTWKEVEIIVTLDNSDEATKAIVYKYKALFSLIAEVDYKDLALSRNHGVMHAKKNFILFADGDDYFSHNTLEALYKTFYKHYQTIATTANDLIHLNDNQHIVAFPHYHIEFPRLLQAEFFDSTDFTVQNNKFLHCFGSRITLYKGLLQKHKLNEDKMPYGYEDWDLNNRLLANGIGFKISNFKLYYRRGDEDSLLEKQLEKKNIVRNSLLYDYKMIDENPSIVEKVPLEESISLPRRGIVWRTLAKSNILRKMYHRIRFHKTPSPSIKSSHDSSIFAEDKIFLESYGEDVLPREDIEYFSVEHFSLHLSHQTKIYNKIMKFLAGKDIIYFFPWIVLGGADKVSVAYTKALQEKNSCVITSITNGERIKQIRIPHLDLISELDDWKILSEDDQLHILVKAIINSHIKLIHIVNSEIAIKSLKYYSQIYQQYKIKTVISLFCPEYDWNNKQWHGFPVLYPEVFKNADLVLLDNHYWYDFFKELNNNKEFKYKKLSSPTEKADISYKVKTDDTKKILWASRICNQKLFGVFEEIVNISPDYIFIIYGSVEEWDQHNKEILNRLIQKRNIEFRGAYQRIDEIDLNEFDLYLFTSLYEGIPTIILDMIMEGIPIVSSDVGGISEVLGKDYPLLVKNQYVASDYINKIKEFYKHKDLITQKIKSIRNVVINEYNENNFRSDYNTIIEELLND